MSDTTKKEAPQTDTGATRDDIPDNAWEAQQQDHARTEGSARKLFRIALAVAIALHLGFLAFHFPQLVEADAPAEEEKPEVYKIQNIQVQPPKPEPKPEPKEEPPEPEAEKIPMPDPEPEQPDPEPEPAPDPEPTPDREFEFVEDTTTEPIQEPQVEMPEIDMAVEIPDGPPEPPQPEGPIRVGGDVAAPVKTSGAEPVYTPNARHARVQGPVIVQAVIDKRGNVTEVKILKDQPMGLGDQAVKAIRSWKFRPATLNGKPVDVYYNLTVNFTLD